MSLPRLRLHWIVRSPFPPKELVILLRKYRNIDQAIQSNRSQVIVLADVSHVVITHKLRKTRNFLSLAESERRVA